MAAGFLRPRARDHWVCEGIGWSQDPGCRAPAPDVPRSCRGLPAPLETAFGSGNTGSKVKFRFFRTAESLLTGCEGGLPSSGPW